MDIFFRIMSNAYYEKIIKYFLAPMPVKWEKEGFMSIEDIKKELQEIKKQYLLAVIAGDQKLIDFYKSRVHSYEKFIECYEKGEEEYKK